MLLADWCLDSHLVMQDMRHFLPEYLHNVYHNLRGDDLRCKSARAFKINVLCDHSHNFGASAYPWIPLTTQNNNQSHLDGSLPQLLTGCSSWLAAPWDSVHTRYTLHNFPLSWQEELYN